ncbi:AmmeMemoRadiSam system protein A [Methylococcus sp. EFPC2]|uniref:AmmeMemoRadiSam system protein A n=1 Tax=Methylococcus sp. EFPC2 TaxID=2812648 RepID=UPI001966D916|nr:AmmeMemoRadiSam system protein A [Methylococcus sp. EFPC2]QSA98313.1 AmmeMemoRadiSam system protein A [Methylococcus sp. EFPC2]
MSSNKHACSLPSSQQRFLMELARQSIRHGLEYGKPLAVNIAALPEDLAAPRASFVTLEKNGRLRGCIGSLQASRALALDIAENAYAAAFRDPRFQPVSAEEVDALEIHLSLLTAPEPMAFASEADLLAQITPEVDGLVLEDGVHRGTFLPSVWESLPDRTDFLRHLKQKAELPADYWSSSLRVSRYRTEVVSEESAAEANPAD